MCLTLLQLYGNMNLSDVSISAYYFINLNIWGKFRFNWIGPVWLFRCNSAIYCDNHKMEAPLKSCLKSKTQECRWSLKEEFLVFHVDRKYSMLVLPFLLRRQVHAAYFFYSICRCPSRGLRCLNLELSLIKVMLTMYVVFTY